jgi:uncharacterized protein
LRDPHCPAYKQVFGAVTDRALAEVFSEENLDAVVTHGPGKYGLMRKGKLLRLMRGGPHPQQVTRQARKLAAAVALAMSDSPADAVQKLERAGLVTDHTRALGSLTALRSELDHQSQGLVNAYLHVTYACNLACDHCYAAAQTFEVSGQPSVGTTSKVLPAMAVDNIVRLVREIAQAGFRKAVITGGEPMAHPRRDEVLDTLAALRGEIKPTQIVLRTNLAYPLTAALIDRLACSADQIVVSVDGDEASHDARRGSGAYTRTVTNLQDLTGFQNLSGLTIAATLTAQQTVGPEGNAVRELGQELSVPVRFKPVLPLGRAAAMPLRIEADSSLDDDADAIALQSRVASTCGLGMNLYIGPGGECFPCYALTGARHALGNALDDGLAAVLARNAAYRRVTVDSNRQCRACALRYVCGGFCRAWGVSDDPNAPAADCSALHQRARGLLVSATETLDVSVERWLAAGLPFPDALPKIE